MDASEDLIEPVGSAGRFAVTVAVTRRGTAERRSAAVLSADGISISLAAAQAEELAECLLEAKNTDRPFRWERELFTIDGYEDGTVVVQTHQSVLPAEVVFHAEELDPLAALLSQAKDHLRFLVTLDLGLPGSEQ